MATEILMPQLGMFMMKGTIVHWLQADRAAVQRADGLVEIQTDKVVHTIEAPASGTLQWVAREGQTLPVRGLIGYVLADGEAEAGAGADAAGAISTPNAGRPAKEQDAPPPAGEVRASPIARRMAAEHGIDLATVVGTGPRGRIGERDVQAAIDRAAQAATEPVVAEPEPAAAEATPMAGGRSAIFDRMAESHRTVARVTEFIEVDATRLDFELGRTQGLSAGDDAVLIWLAARALQEHRALNCSFVDGAIRLWPEINVGLAVDTEGGLLTPVVRRADRRGLAEIAGEVRAMVERARAGLSTPDDLSGGTFTITNLGAYDVDGFTPIVNLPECAGLGVGRVASRPVVDGGRIAIRQMMTLSLSFDHRLVDGAPAARFLQRLKQLIEDPFLLLTSNRSHSGGI